MANFPGARAIKAVSGAIADYDWASYRELLTPKLITVLARGYTRADFAKDAFAGLTVAVLALPLSMAIAIGAGFPPGTGLVTAVVAGLLISALGGSRFQVGGPAAAFIVIVASVAAQHGANGLMTATFLAGLILVVAGLVQLGTYIKYIPGPVVTGFTSGIGLIIAIAQLKDFLGLVGPVPGDVMHKLQALWAIRSTLDLPTLLIGLATLAGIIGLKRWRPEWPGLLIAVVATSALVAVLGLPVETIRSRFGELPSGLPSPTLPDLSLATIRAVLPESLTIAFLIGVESLLSAVAADTMAGTRHRSNMEIVAQGVANVASPLFGGLPATGVIARTGTNITAGARSPVAGILHALFVLAFMLLAAPLAGYLALSSLAAVLLITAWRLLEIEHVARFMTRAPWDDRIVLAVTLLLTVAVDLSVAIAVGVVIASMLFMHRMAETPGVKLGVDHLVLDDVPDRVMSRSQIMTMELPPGVRVFELTGPLFFGATARLGVAFASLPEWPKALILRMRDVPLIDVTAIGALEDLAQLARQNGCRIIISGLQAQPRAALHRYGFLREHHIVLASNSYMALEKAERIVAGGVVTDGSEETE